jgi:cytochrome c biogenesis protein CcmG/thiol:disulfide interchange protein DsbE
MTPFKWATAVIAALSIAFIVILAVQNQQQNTPNFDLVGELSPDIEGESARGEAIDLDQILQQNRSKVPAQQTWVAVNFFASWCSGCIVEHGDLLQFHEEGVVNDDGVVCPTQLLGVAFNDEEADVKDFFDRLGGDWPVVVGSETNQIALDFSVLTAPETFLIAPSGLIVLKVIGPVTYQRLSESISC